MPDKERECQNVRWIPAKEKMPTENGYYLVAIMPEHVSESPMGAVAVALCDKVLSGNRMEWDFFGDAVTHWMELPAAPDSRPSTEEK